MATSAPRAAVALFLLAAGGCASTQIEPSTTAREALLSGAPPGLAAEAKPIPQQAQFLAVNDEMERFLAAHVSPRAGADVRLRQLTDAIMNPRTFGLQYDTVTRTASETFRTRRGNCLSFSTMFVALARRAGLDADFQEVDVPPSWTLSNDTFVLNQHVNVHVDIGLHGRRVVDFNIADFRSSYDMRMISDARALAHFYNNVGVERMQAGDAASALVCFRKAVTEGDERFAAAWTNLGTLYSRYGDRVLAEAAYLEALAADHDDLVVMSNLARLYELNGDPARAAAFEKKVAEHRNLNPYYRYQLARQAYAAHRYDEAIGHLKYAVRKVRRERRFYALLGLAYLEKGDGRTARRWAALSERMGAADAVKKVLR
jgi:Flp pilus assembly protein TadD